MLYHTAGYVERTFRATVGDKTRVLRFRGGQLKAKKTELPFLRAIPPHHPVFDEAGKQVNTGKKKG